MGAPIEWDDSRFGHHLVSDGDVLGCLDDLVVVVVAGWKRRHAVVQEAALLERTILPRVGRAMAAPGQVTSRDTLLALSGQRRKPAVCRFDNERRALQRHATIPPFIVVGQADVCDGIGGTGLGSRRGLFRPRGPFLVGQELAAREVLGALQWRRGAVVPDPLEIGMPPRRMRHRPLLGWRRTPGARRRCLTCDRGHRGQDQQRGRQRERLHGPHRATAHIDLPRGS